MSSMRAGFLISIFASRQIPALNMRGIMSQPYMWGAFLIPSESYAEDIAPIFLPFDSIIAERIKISKLFLPPFDIKSVMSNVCGISIFDVSPTFLPFTNMSANVSIPSSRSIARSPLSSLGDANSREKSHW